MSWQLGSRSFVLQWLHSGDAPNALMGGIIFVAVGLFLSEYSSIAAINGWWVDELYSLWASDPSLTFAAAFVDRITTDSNPPLYYLALYWTRVLIADERGAIVALNMVVILAAIAAVVTASQRAGIISLGFLGAGVFLLSGPVLRFAQEGRTYLSAIALAFSLSWYCALAIEEPQHRPSLASFGLIGILAALLHVYAAILCGALATGLVVLAIFWRRRDLAPPGLILGTSACVVFAIWLGLAWGNGHISWIVFTPRSVFVAAADVKQLAVGTTSLIVPLTALLLFGLVRPATRPLTVAFCTAFWLFVFLPLIASFKQPMINGRYWMIGAPALIVLLVFLARAWLTEGSSVQRRIFSLIACCCALMFLVASDVLGFVAARKITAEKLIWNGALIVAPVVHNCPAASIHVIGFIPGFAKTASAPEALFVDAAAATTEAIAPANAACPVLGWAEHMPPGDEFMQRASDEELLRLLKIGASPAEVDIRRHYSGYVVLRRGN